MLALRPTLIVLALGVAGCGPVESTVTELSEACARSDGDAVVVDARFAECLSSSCDTLESARCELTLEDDVLTVTGEAVIRSKQYGACTSDCGFVDARCSLELPPGEYTIAGAAAGELVITHPLAEPAGECETFSP